MLRLTVIFLMCSLLSISPVAGKTSSAASSVENDEVTKVICNVIIFVQKLGLPIMTGVILGSSIMAIFGRLPWPAIVMLVVFTAIFFGASKLVGKFAKGVNASADTFDCSTIAATQK